ncbi:MAG: hypothetical protein AAB401_25240 [Acidobacteriota bacterium]
MTNRRQLLKTVIAAGAGASLLPPEMLFASAMRPTNAQANETLYVNPATGRDNNSGAKDAPLKSLPEVARRVNASAGTGAFTALLSEGIYSVDETVLLSPKNRKFTKENRLTIRAEVLPDDPEWNIGRMPTLIHTMPLGLSWNGRPDPLGGVADGILVETSHVTIRGLRVLGIPVVESPKAGQIRRLYAISRLRRDLEDLEVAQCLLIGDELIAPNHVSIIAHGNGVNVHHCIFRGQKISVVYWTPGSTGHAMHHCVLHDVYGSAVWTASIANDFEYKNNVVSDSNYVWTAQGGASASADAGARGGQPAAPATAQAKEAVHYKVIDSYLAHNRRLAGSGTGARLEYKDIDAGFLEMIGTKTSEQSITFEHDQSKRNYLHPVAGSEAAKVGAGLFLKPSL